MTRLSRCFFTADAISVGAPRMTGGKDQLAVRHLRSFSRHSRIRVRADAGAMVPLQVQRNTPNRIPSERLGLSGWLRHGFGPERSSQGDGLACRCASRDHHIDQVCLEFAYPEHALDSRGNLPAAFPVHPPQ